MNMHYILKDGEPVEESDLLAWARWFERHEQRVLAQTEVVPGVEVSTVFLGVDHAFGDGPPVLWETMVFGLEDDDPQWRYSTREEAEKGHQRAVEWTREALFPFGPSNPEGAAPDEDARAEDTEHPLYEPATELDDGER